MLGSVSAQDDLNATADNILKDTQYTGDVDDDEGVLEVEQNSYIPVEVKVDEAWSLNVLIDKQPSQINGEYENTTDSHADIPTSRIVEGEEHRWIWESTGLSMSSSSQTPHQSTGRKPTSATMRCFSILNLYEPPRILKMQSTSSTHNSTWSKPQNQ